MVSKIWASIKGKRNPRTNKPFTESDAYAIATTAWKKAHGGKAPGREAFEDWKVLEFYMPIKEATMVGDDFLIKGIAINETTTRNGIKYVATELDKAAPSFRNKPILLDHKNEVKNIVGRTTENVRFSSEKAGIEFEAKIMDKDIQKMINDGRIQEVSIGASVKDLVDNEEDNSKTAVGLEGMEISLVAVPGDPGASLAMAMDNSFEIREKLKMAEEMLDDIQLNIKEVIQMAEEEEQKEEKPEEEEKEEKKPAEEKINVNIDMSGVQKQIAELSKQVAELAKVKEQEDTPPAEKPAEEEKPAKEPEDETKGEVGGEEESEESEPAEEGYVIEKADTGKGFAIWRDYDKTPGKFKRLVR